MLSFVDWIDQKQFWIKSVWDDEKKMWGGPGWLKLYPTQRRIFEHCLTPDEDGHFPYTTIIYSCPKKSGKTALEAAVGVWFAEEAIEGTEIYNIANDKEKTAAIALGDMQYHVRNSGRHEVASVTAHKIVFENDTTIQSLAQSYRSGAGFRHALTLWDELWGYESELARRAWDELTPIPTVPVSLRFIATYAGFVGESHLLWDLYTKVVDKEEHEDGQGEKIPGLEDLPCYRNGRTFAYWDHEPRMPWQTKEYYDNQLIELRPAAYLRYHRNEWVTTHEKFIPDGLWETAEGKYPQSVILWKEHPYRNVPIYIAVDAATKWDTTAMVGCAYDSGLGKVIVVFHKIWTPVEGERFDLQATVEKELYAMGKKFNIAQIVHDPRDLHDTMTRVARTGIPVVEYAQTVSNMMAVSQNLYDLLQGGNLWAYPAPDLAEHIRNSVAEDKGKGFRIVKRKSTRGRQKIDAAIALAMAAYAAIEGGGVDFAIPVQTIHSPFHDSTAWPDPNAPDQSTLPFALRTDK